MTDKFARAFGDAISDIRTKVLEEGWFGKAVTGRRQTITMGSPGDEKSLAEQLGWFRSDDRSQQPTTPEYDRDGAAKDIKPADRGIDL